MNQAAGNKTTSRPAGAEAPTEHMIGAATDHDGDSVEYRQHAAVFALATMLIVSCWAASVAYPSRLEPKAVPGPAAPGVLAGIDPNEADWWELAQLPGVGPSLARRIVAFREERRPLSAGAPVFETPADLIAVKGIGAKTMARVCPFLRVAKATTDVDNPAGGR